MSWDMHTFYRPCCDWPDCGIRYDGGEREWWADESDARESVWEDPWWLLLDDDGGSVRFFCPDHLLFADDGQPVRFDPDADDDKGLPRNAELIPYNLDSGMQPLPKPECEDTIREILKGDGK